MSIVSEIRSLDTSDALLAVIVFSSCVTPGFLVIQLYKPGLIVDLDIVKLVVFSVALTSPQLAASLVTLATLDIVTASGLSDSAKQRDIAAWISLWAFVALYMSLLIAYIARLSFREFLVVVAAVNVACALLVWLILRQRKTNGTAGSQ